MSDSFPYFFLAKKWNKQYGYILRQVTFFEENPTSIDYWSEMKSCMMGEVAEAVAKEQARRRECLPKS